MAKITKEEVLKIAAISHIKLYEEEIEPLIKQLERVLSYAERVNDLAATNVEEVSNKAVNMWREDVCVPTNPEPLLAQAPETEEHYFVVPRILENN